MPNREIETMEKIIDKYLDGLISIELNKLPIEIVPEMSDPNQHKNEEWRVWNLIQSKVNEKEVAEFESELGYKLPESYKKFLKHKHFYELQIGEYSFREHPAGIWRELH